MSAGCWCHCLSIMFRQLLLSQFYLLCVVSWLLRNLQLHDMHWVFTRLLLQSGTVSMHAVSARGLHQLPKWYMHQVRDGQLLLCVKQLVCALYNRLRSLSRSQFLSRVRNWLFPTGRIMPTLCHIMHYMCRFSLQLRGMPSWILSA